MLRSVSQTSGGSAARPGGGVPGSGVPGGGVPGGVPGEYGRQASLTSQAPRGHSYSRQGSTTSVGSAGAPPPQPQQPPPQPQPIR